MEVHAMDSSPKTDAAGFVLVDEGAMACKDADFENLWLVGMGLPRSRNPRNPKQFLRRRQGTYGVRYNFGQENNYCGEVPVTGLLRWCVDEARKRSGSQKYVGAHVNWYPDGAGVSQHQDNEDEWEKGAPIYSFSFGCLLYTSPSPRDGLLSRMPSSA